MRPLLIAVLAVVMAGCGHVTKKSSLASDPLAGVYDGRDVVDTEERLTLSADQTFTYDFIPLGPGGESYTGHWMSKDNLVILVAKLESGEEVEFPLEVAYEKGFPILTYSWTSLEKARGRMMIPNVFVRSSKPNKSATAQRP